ncbi:tyrosine-type recombinase/integrase [Paractinoplanes ferrugineus]|uniref:Integrase n=1 Tax=Paractinoplanes ferrugineus TaxID=113564 RepID=A0A919J6F1_9ACTN|nr:tyrosine-type recombinase/integrase [Actinoplanes ferrugineus]GIE14157.1 integrase [Actinoplanes ferrugineus]
MDHLDAEEILALFPGLRCWDQVGRHVRSMARPGARRILAWLGSFPGDGWQQRWLNSGAENDEGWLDAVCPEDGRTRGHRIRETYNGLSFLLACRVVRPGYPFLARYRPQTVYAMIRAVISPEVFERVEKAGAEAGIGARHLGEAMVSLTKIVLHSGKTLDQLTSEDVLAYRDWYRQRTGRTKYGLHGAWDVLVAIGVLPVGSTLRRTTRLGQLSTAELVDRHGIANRPIRDLLVRYLGERRPSMDYGAFLSLSVMLVSNFWTDIEAHHPGIDTLHLPPEVVDAWKERLRVWTGTDGTTRERRNYIDVLIRIRGFYLDLQEWALHDPSWAPWAVPSPIRKGDTAGLIKTRRKVIAEMHQRVRDRLPNLPVLVDTAERHRREHTALLAFAGATPIGETFEHAGRTYRRTVHKAYTGPGARPAPETVVVEDLDGGELLDLNRTEDDAFWAWAVIETLRHTGVRMEELLEITHLALISYPLPDTGEVVPLLQIVPSKTDQERLLLVTPELASVLASIITRIRGADGRVPLVARWDEHERVLGPALPHLFQRKYVWRDAVISTTTVQKLISATITRAGLVDRTGKPLRYTPHDFRRMFATEAVTGGLPVHIAARILGHTSLSTTQTYLAVFQDELIRSYRAFVDQRRATRPEAEYREPTDEEWTEFQQHFQLRKLELGTCGRPYGTPCQHEHACVRCPMLRIEPAQRQRLTEIIDNLQHRITEAQERRWLGEVQGLQISLDAAKAKLAALDRMTAATAAGPTLLGLPAGPAKKLADSS